MHLLGQSAGNACTEVQAALPLLLPCLHQADHPPGEHSLCPNLQTAVERTQGAMELSASGMEGVQCSGRELASGPAVFGHTAAFIVKARAAIWPAATSSMLAWVQPAAAEVGEEQAVQPGADSWPSDKRCWRVEYSVLSMALLAPPSARADQGPLSLSSES